ncbi:hypothetical protein [Paenibacillus polymyxa]|uniref:hypothetical protein n=1 Tax=Paenibacillus polymyxa TaxID=1406 RepID=UPI001378D3BE|nr:hypothetical protein [Paenibacillus polymyxa]
MPKHNMRRPPPRTTRRILKEGDFTADASRAEDLNLEKRRVRLCHGILTFSCLSNPKNPVATAIVRSNPSRSAFIHRNSLSI